MFWRLIIWAGVAWGCGWFLDRLFEPTDPLFIKILYILPFFFFGFLYQRRLRTRYSWFHTRPLFSVDVTHQRLTFWGIPISKETPIRSETARRGEGLLPVILTSPPIRDKQRRSVQAGFRQLSKRDIKRITSELSSPQEKTFLSTTMRAGRRGGRLVGMLLLLVGSQLRAITKLVIFALLCAAGVWYFLPNKAQLNEIAGNVQLKLQKTGDTITFLDAVNDLYVPLEKIPRYFRQALVFREDRRFYTHWGWDWPGKGRAAYQTTQYVFNKLLHRRQGSFQGGSTITQQLAKNLFLSEESSLIRKFREMILAFKLEWYYSKDEILEMYLNKAFFGPKRGSYGIEVAARSYFNKNAADLNLYESALLIQAIPNPYQFNVKKDEALARRRADRFLDTLRQYGRFRLGDEDVEFSSTQIQQAIRRGVEYGQRTLKRRETRYLFDWIRPQLQRAPYFASMHGEFTVVTTLNSEVQIYAEEAFNQVLSDPVRRERQASQAALAAMTPDGAVRAILGGRDYAESQYHRAISAQRQPGSTFKMFVYLSALEHGWTPDSVIDDLPVTIEKKAITNVDGKFLGRISLTRALALSRNAAAVNLIQQPDIGVQNVIEAAHRLGITANLSDTPGLALGISEVTLLELTTAYSVLANGGFAVTPYGIIGVRTKSGNIRYWYTPPQRTMLDRLLLAPPIVSGKQVSQMNRMLQAVITEPDGTGRRAQFGDYPVAGKTGTTDDYRDAWFVGFTSHLCAGIWVGNDDNRPMDRISGGTLPVDIFREFMRRTHEYLHLEPQPLP